ncbi:hypothetical protein OF83DRAFT_1171610 [Amylostereum chailletii]|nr:hypothetical protein OF83DRAFT_1171610 [Amylostereum chailletii]
MATQQFAATTHENISVRPPSRQHLRRLQGNREHAIARRNQSLSQENVPAPHSTVEPIQESHMEEYMAFVARGQRPFPPTPQSDPSATASPPISSLLLSTPSHGASTSEASTPSSTTVTSIGPIRRGRRSAGDKKVAKLAANAKRPTFRLWADNPALQAVLRKACEKVHVHIVTAYPFPSTSRRTRTAEEKYCEVLVEHGLDIQDSINMFDRNKQDIILREENQAHSRMRKAVQVFLEGSYGLKKNPANEEETLHNQSRATWLLDKSRYTYKDINHSARTVQGKFRNKIIEDVVHALWFHNAHALGFKYPSDFNPVKNESMALIFTVVEFELSQYAPTGKPRSSAKFQSSRYPIYDALLAKIGWFESDDSALWLQTRQKISNDAKAATSANVQIEEDLPTDNDSAEERERELVHLRQELSFDMPDRSVNMSSTEIGNPQPLEQELSREDSMIADVSMESVAAATGSAGDSADTARASDTQSDYGRVSGLDSTEVMEDGVDEDAPRQAQA